jgi:hypothetical protein
MEELKKTMAAMQKQLQKLDKLDEVSKKLDNLDSRFSHLEKAVESNQARIGNVEKDVENVFVTLQMAHELTVSGIPAEHKKSPEEVFELVSSSLGYDETTLPATTVYNLPGRNVFVIRFATIFDKDEFLQRYVKIAKTLTLKALRIANDKKSRVYIQHNLPQKIYKIHKYALSQVKSGILHKVKLSSYGEIMIRVAQRSRFVAVRNGNELDALLASIKNK